MNSLTLTQFKDLLGEGMRAFLRWWLAELEGMAPAGLRRRLPRGRRTAVWDLSGDAIRVWHQERGWRPVDASRSGKTGRKTPTAVDVVIDPGLVFRKEISLPKMPLPQVRAALRLQLSRHVPFRPPDIIFDCRLTGEDAAAATVTAELAMVRRCDAADIEQSLSVYGVTPRRIGLIAEGPEPRVQFNFREGAQTSRFTRLHGLLALLAGILALSTLFAVEDRREAELAAWRAAAAEQAMAAAEVKALRKDLTALEERTAFLEDQWSITPRTELLNTLSAALPDGTWLESIEITGEKIRLTGYSQKASSVPEWLQKTGKVTELRFVSGVSSTAQKGVDRFDVEGVIP